MPNHLGIFVVLSIASLAHAVPSLQLGAYDGAGGFVNYTSIGDDKDTAFITSGPLLAAGAFGSNVVSLGGMYSGGDDWSHFGGVPSAFNGHGAILMMTVFADRKRYFRFRGRF